MLVCNICDKEARYRVIIDCGRFIDRLFFCEEHKPQSMIMGEMDKKQHDTNINTLLTTLPTATSLNNNVRRNSRCI